MFVSQVHKIEGNAPDCICVFGSFGFSLLLQAADALRMVCGSRKCFSKLKNESVKLQRNNTYTCIFSLLECLPISPAGVCCRYSRHAATGQQAHANEMFVSHNIGRSSLAMRLMNCATLAWPDYCVVWGTVYLGPRGLCPPFGVTNS